MTGERRSHFDRKLKHETVSRSLRAVSFLRAFGEAGVNRPQQRARFRNAMLVSPKPLMVTDPPYGVDYDPGWRNRATAAGRLKRSIRSSGRVENDAKADWHDAWILFSGDVAYVWHGGTGGSIPRTP